MEVVEMPTHVRLIISGKHDKIGDEFLGLDL